MDDACPVALARRTEAGVEARREEDAERSEHERVTAAASLGSTRAVNIEGCLLNGKGWDAREGCAAELTQCLHAQGSK